MADWHGPETPSRRNSRHGPPDESASQDRCLRPAERGTNQENLAVIVDENGRRTISVTWPLVTGNFTRSDHHHIAEFRGLDLKFGHGTPDKLNNWLGFGCLSGLLGATTIGLLLASRFRDGLLVGICWMLLALVGFGVTFRGRAKVPSSSEEQYLVLDQPSDVEIFDKALDAGKKLIASWQQVHSVLAVGELPMQVGPEVGDSLWLLAGLLRQRATLAAQSEELDQAFADLPPQSEVYQQVQQRSAQAQRQITRLDTEILSRVAALECLAEESLEFARYARAVDGAFKLIEGVDRSLEASGQYGDHRTDPGQDLSDRARGLIHAYHELTSVNRADQ
jgi:hypothetical protein